MIVFCCSQLFSPRISCIILFNIKATINSSVKTSLKFLFVFQYIPMFIYLCRVGLYANIAGVLFDIVWFSRFTSWVLSMMFLFINCCCTSFLLCPSFRRYFRSFFKFSCVVHIRFNCHAWENGIASFDVFWVLQCSMEMELLVNFYCT